MRSATSLDRRLTAIGTEVHELLVLWQHPDSREIVPIGRFAHHGDVYSFSYTRAAALIQDFRPLPGLDDLNGAYVADRIPPVFEQRVMEPGRPDYEHYLHALGLGPLSATPWEQIVYSGGRRAGDTLQFMPLPTVFDGRVHARFLGNGVRHIPDRTRIIGGRSVTVSLAQQEDALCDLMPGATVLVELEHGNEEDPDAAVITAEGVPVGLVPRVLSSSIRELMAGSLVPLTIVRIGDPGSPPHLRLVLSLDMAAPLNFQFDRDGRWEPLAAQ